MIDVKRPFSQTHRPVKELFCTRSISVQKTNKQNMGQKKNYFCNHWISSLLLIMLLWSLFF